MAKKRTTIAQMREKIEVLTVSDEVSGEFSITNSYTTAYSIRARVREVTRWESKNGIARFDNEITHSIITRRGGDIDNIDDTVMLRWNGMLLKVVGKDLSGLDADDTRKRFWRIDAVFDSIDETYQDASPEVPPEPEEPEEEEPEEPEELPT